VILDLRAIQAIQELRVILAFKAVRETLVCKEGLVILALLGIMVTLVRKEGSETLGLLEIRETLGLKEMWVIQVQRENTVTLVRKAFLVILEPLD